MQLLLKVQELVTLALHHACHRDSCPACHNLSDIIGSNLLTHESVSTFIPSARIGSAVGLQVAVSLCYIILKSLDAAVAYLRHTLIVALALSTLSLKLQLFHKLFLLLYLVYQQALPFPRLTEILLLSSQRLYVTVEHSELLLVILTLYGLTLNLQLSEPACYLVELLWDRVTFHAQFGGSLIHEVYGLVREETL